jgi:hypothetical protein
MTKIAILQMEDETGENSFLATYGDKQVTGRTAGEALDALTSQLPPEETGAMIVVQTRQPDRFFNAVQQKRLADLMERWKKCRDEGKEFSDLESAELERLVEAELSASTKRAESLASESGV